MMRGSTGFDAYEARRQLLEEWHNVAALELAANDYITCRVNSVDLKNRLGDVETNCRDRLHGWLLRIVGASTAPTSMALPCRWRSRPQHQERTSNRPYRPPFVGLDSFRCRLVASIHYLKMTQKGSQPPSQSTQINHDHRDEAVGSQCRWTCCIRTHDREMHCIDNGNRHDAEPAGVVYQKAFRRGSPFLREPILGVGNLSPSLCKSGKSCHK